MLTSSIPELSMSVISPGENLAIARQSHAVAASSRNGDHILETRDSYWSWLIRTNFIPELSTEIGSPGENLAIARQSHAVAVSSRNGDRILKILDSYWS